MRGSLRLRSPAVVGCCATDRRVTGDTLARQACLSEEAALLHRSTSWTAAKGDGRLSHRCPPMRAATPSVRTRLASTRSAAPPASPLHASRHPQVRGSSTCFGGCSELFCDSHFRVSSLPPMPPGLTSDLAQALQCPMLNLAQAPGLFLFPTTTTTQPGDDDDDHDHDHQPRMMDRPVQPVSTFSHASTRVAPLWAALCHHRRRCT